MREARTGPKSRPTEQALIAANEQIREMGYLVDSSSHYILGVRARAQAASTIVL